MAKRAAAVAAVELLDAVPVEVPGVSLSGPAPTPIKLGGPLSIRITSVFPGDQQHMRGRTALLTSAVRSPMLHDAAPLAVHYLYNSVKYGSILTSKADLPGSDVVYYSAGELNSSLDVTVRLSFDSFNRATFDSWIEAAATAAQLPVFAVSGPTGAAWVAVARGAAKLITRAIDSVVDGDNDRVMTWRLNLADPGHDVVKPGYVLLYPDGNTLMPAPAAEGGAFEREGKQFVAANGTLRWRDDSSREVREGDSYVLVYVNGAKMPELNDWAAAAVSAELTEKFFNAEKVGADDVLEAFKSFNDMTWLRRIDEFDRDLASLEKKPKTSEVKTEIKALSTKRDAALRNVRDETVRGLVQGTKPRTSK